MLDTYLWSGGNHLLAWSEEAHLTTTKSVSLASFVNCFANGLSCSAVAEHVSLLVAEHISLLNAGYVSLLVAERVPLLDAENVSLLAAGHVSRLVAQDLCRSTQEL